jgi:hypothetical protein
VARGPIILGGVLGFAALSALLTSCRATLPSAATAQAATLESLGLVWTECPVSGYPEPSWQRGCAGEDKLDDAEVATMSGEAVDDLGDFQLTIGKDAYHTTSSRPPDEFPTTVHYTLFKNGAPMTSLSGRYVSYPPSIDLLNVEGKAAWEFDDGEDQTTVIYDGRDLRTEYGLDRARVPHVIAGKLIFVGSKNGRSFVMYDGQRIGPDFDRIYVYYCCEAAWTSSVRRGRDSYGFLGARNGQAVAVVISRRGNGTPVPTVGTAGTQAPNKP